MILVLLGFSVTAYLLWRHIVLTGQWEGPEGDICSALFRTGCDETLRSNASVQLGLPLAGWGVVFYGTLLSLLLLARALGRAFEFEAHVAAFLISVPGFVTSVILSGVMAVESTLFCPLCVVVHAINLALVLALKSQTGKTTSQLFQSLRDGGTYILTGKSSNPEQARWKMTGFLVVALVAVVLYQWVFIEAGPREEVRGAPTPEQIIAAFDTTSRNEIPVGPDDPALGPADASVRIVVFSDFQCPACRTHANELYRMAEEYANQLQIVFKHFPLDKGCNPLIKIDYHRHACLAARAAEAARIQGAFWPFHDKLFAVDLNTSSEALDSLARAIGLNLPRFRSSLEDPAVSAKVQSDVALGIRLAVDVTPSIFFNGRRVRDTRSHTMRLLLEHLLHQYNK